MFKNGLYLFKDQEQDCHYDIFVSPDATLYFDSDEGVLIGFKERETGNGFRVMEHYKNTYPTKFEIFMNKFKIETYYLAKIYPSIVCTE